MGKGYCKFWISANSVASSVVHLLLKNNLVSKIRENIPKKTNGKILEKVVANLLSKRENDCTPTPMVSDNDQGISNDKTSESEAEEIENNNDSR